MREIYQRGIDSKRFGGSRVGRHSAPSSTAALPPPAPPFRPVPGMPGPPSSRRPSTRSPFPARWTAPRCTGRPGTARRSSSRPAGIPPRRPGTPRAARHPLAAGGPLRRPRLQVGPAPPGTPPLARAGPAAGTPPAGSHRTGTRRAGAGTRHPHAGRPAVAPVAGGAGRGGRPRGVERGQRTAPAHRRPRRTARPRRRRAARPQRAGHRQRRGRGGHPTGRQRGGVRQPAVRHPRLAQQPHPARCQRRSHRHRRSRPVGRQTVKPAAPARHAAAALGAAQRGAESSCFCMRWGVMHDGIDLAGPLGSPDRGGRRRRGGRGRSRVRLRAVGGDPARQRRLQHLRPHVHLLRHGRRARAGRPAHRRHRGQRPVHRAAPALRRRPGQPHRPVPRPGAVAGGPRRSPSAPTTRTPEPHSARSAILPGSCRYGAASATQDGGRRR